MYRIAYQKLEDKEGSLRVAEQETQQKSFKNY